MLIILNDPAGITGRERNQLDPSKTLQENIEQHLSSGYECELAINGVVVDPLTHPAMDKAANPADLVVLTRRPAGADPVSITLASLWGGRKVAQALVGTPDTGASSVYSAAITGVTKDSPNNSLTVQTNVARAYQAIPDVYGRRRVWPDLIQPSTVEYIDNLKYVTEWMCVSRGKGTVSAVKYADTPILDIDGASYELFSPSGSGYPEDGVTTISDVLETFASDEVNGQEIDYPGAIDPFTREGDVVAVSGATTFTITFEDGGYLDGLKYVIPSGTAAVSFSYGTSSTFSQTCTVLSCTVASGYATFTFSCSAWAAALSESGAAVTVDPVGDAPQIVGPFTLPIECDRIHWNTTFLRGLKGSVQIKAEWWQVDESGYEISGTRQTQTDTYSADTYDQLFYTKKVTPSAGSGMYRIQFKRLNAQVDTNGSDVAKLEELYAVRYYSTKELPGVTIIRVTTKATTAATGYSDRKFNVMWYRHVRTLTSDTLSTSRNFARSMAHIWTLAGNSMATLDVDKLAEINATYGEDSALLRFDGSLDDADVSLGERMQMIANHARCVLWRDGGKWTVTRDEARPYPELQLDYRNIDSGGESTITYSAHLPASYNGIELEYVNEQTQATKAYIRLSIETGTVVEESASNPKKIKLQGCTTRSQALNRAHLEARRILYQRTSVAETALSDAGFLGIGSLIRWIDPHDFEADDGLQAGEVMSITGNVIATSEPINWQGAAVGRILITGEDGAYLSGPLLCYPSGDDVMLATVPDGIFVADQARQCGSRYTLCIGLSGAEMQSAGLYTISTIRPDGSGSFSLGFVQYDERMFEED
jgi:hypothetical protein